MSVKRGTTSISKIYKGTSAISKIYLGTNLVFEEEAPLWVIGTNKGMWISKDGITYTNISTIAIYNGPHYNKKKIITGCNSGSALYVYNIEDLRKGSFTRTQTTKLVSSSYASWGIGTDGQGVLLASIGLSGDNRIFYSFDNGQTWSSVNCGLEHPKFYYIGDGRFVLIQGNSYENTQPVSAANGVYYYWDKAHPTTAKYSLTYKLPDSSYPYSGAATWMYGIFVTENGAVFVKVKTGSNQYKWYKGTLTQAASEVTTPVSNWEPKSIVYVYDKYWATDEGNSVSRLYSSTDGITWTEHKNGTSDFFTSRGGSGATLEKNNGKLCYFAHKGCGVIKSNLSVSKTMDTFISTTGFGPIGHTCNKFHKM